MIILPEFEKTLINARITSVGKLILNRLAYEIKMY